MVTTVYVPSYMYVLCCCFSEIVLCLVKLLCNPHVDHVLNKANCLLGFLQGHLYNAPTQIKEYVDKQLLLPSTDFLFSYLGPIPSHR